MVSSTKSESKNRTDAILGTGTALLSKSNYKTQMFPTTISQKTIPSRKRVNVRKMDIPRHRGLIPRAGPIDIHPKSRMRSRTQDRSCRDMSLWRFSPALFFL